MRKGATHAARHSTTPPHRRCPAATALCLCLCLQANTQIAYLKAIRVTLDAALSIRNFASQVVERHNKPEVEARYEHTDRRTDGRTDRRRRRFDRRARAPPSLLHVSLHERLSSGSLLLRVAEECAPSLRPDCSLTVGCCGRSRRACACVPVSLSKELLLAPVVIARNEQEKCLIEGSVNSVRISILIKQSDELEKVLVDRSDTHTDRRAAASAAHCPPLPAV